jgi:hypothetical protein
MKGISYKILGKPKSGDERIGFLRSLCRNEKPQGKRKTINTGSFSGFLEGALLVFGSKKIGYYHEERGER